MTPSLSIVVLTLDEERSIGRCLDSLRNQSSRDFEVIVIDAASTDATAEIVRAHQSSYPVPLRLEVATHRIPVGEARNHGVRLARAPSVAFLSADAEADPTWVEAALRALRHDDIVFGRQLHTPDRWTVGAAVRGLRYHFPDGPAADPLRYASNVAAAYRREVLEALPFDPWTSVDDLLLATRASRAGYLVAYDPRLRVRHLDVTGARAEARKNLREARSWATHARELGLHRPILAWAFALLLALAALPLQPLPAIAALILILYAPALRRALRHGRAMPRAPLALAIAASPLFDLLFLGSYARSLALAPLPRRRSRPTEDAS